MWTKDENGRWHREVNGCQCEVYQNHFLKWCIRVDGRFFGYRPDFLSAEAQAEKIAKTAPWRQ